MIGEDNLTKGKLREFFFFRNINSESRGVYSLLDKHIKITWESSYQIYVIMF